MKTKLQKLGEEIVPLSSKQNFLLFLLIACIFQFLLFFTPALAAEAVASDEVDDLISLSTPTKTSELDAEAQAVVNRLVSNPDKISIPTTPGKEVRSLSPQVIPSQEKAVVEGSSLPESPEYRVVRTSTHVITAYNSEAAQTDDSPCITANGFNVCEHGVEDTIAANFLKMGTRVRIPDLFGDQIFVVRDRMNKRHAARVDVWMLKRSDAINFGVRSARIEILEEV